MRFDRIAFAGLTAAALTFAAAPAATAATTYDAVADFSGTNPSGAWQYGWDAGSGFTAFNTYVVGATGNACATGLACWYQTDMVQYLVPMVAKNTTSGTISYANTVVHPVDVLNIHPGHGDNGAFAIDAIIRFVAPTTSTYSYNGFFQALDISPSGVAITINGSPVAISGSANMGAMTVGSPTAFSGAAQLAAGDYIEFRVNRAGEIWNDSTGFAAQITAVPEPATWGLMILGFGGAGAMLRTRRRVVAA